MSLMNLLCKKCGAVKDKKYGCLCGYNPKMTCIKCRRGSFENSEEKIICMNCGKEEIYCSCSEVK